LVRITKEATAAVNRDHGKRSASSGEKHERVKSKGGVSLRIKRRIKGLLDILIDDGIGGKVRGSRFGTQANKGEANTSKTKKREIPGVELE